MLLAHFEASRALLVYKSRWEIEKRFKFCCVIKLIRRVSVPSLHFTLNIYLIIPVNICDLSA